MARSYDIAILSQKVEQLGDKIEKNDVVANPSGSASTLLKKIGIDGTNYNVPHTAANIDYESGSVKTALDKMVKPITLTASEYVNNVNNLQAAIINGNILVITGYTILTANVTTSTTIFTLSETLTNTRYGTIYAVAQDKTRVVKIEGNEFKANIDIAAGNLWINIVTII